MRHRLLKIAVYHIRLIAIVMVLLLPGVLIVSAKAERFYLQLWQQLGISKQESGGNIKETFMFGFIYHGGFNSIKHIISGDRVAVAEDILMYTKMYVNSDAFKRDYGAYRESRKPVLNLTQPNETAVRTKYIGMITAQMKQMKESIGNAPDDKRKMYEDVYVLLKQQLKDFQDPQSKTIVYVMQNEMQLYQKALADHNTAVKKWETDYPNDHQLFVKTRLQQFLQSTANVDYAATTVTVNGNKHFKDLSYDCKNESWKSAHNAGKEVTETVRTFVSQWVAEI